MSKPILEIIDVMQFAKGKRVVRGRYPMASLQRLSSIIGDAKEHIEFEVQFFLDTDRTVVLDGQIKATLSLTCQRCLEPLTHTIDARFRLGAVKHESLTDRLSDDYEPLILDDAGCIHLQNVIEDELILNIPHIAKHTTACINLNPDAAQENTQTETHENPFAVLHKLKRQ